MRIALALQGGGAHGAYTWGVLDRLLQVPGLEIHAISGASAGAVNAVALAEGWRRDGAAGARHRLDVVWHTISGRPHLSAWLGAIAPLGWDRSLQHAAMRHAFAMTRWMTPEQMNPFDIDPLRMILDAEIDFAALAKSSGMAMFISATDVARRSAHIFGRQELSRDVILASSCLPHLHRGVMIEGRLYWDGGLSANPPIWPLILQADATQIVLVRLASRAVSEAAQSVEEVRAEMLELAFEAPLTAELASLEGAKRLAERAWLSLGPLERRLRQLRIHQIGSPDWLAGFDPISKADTAPSFLADLKAAGRSAAEQWLSGMRPPQ